MLCITVLPINFPRDSVPVTITGGPSEPEVKTLPKHKKNAEVGEKKTVFSSNIFVEQEDALSFEDQEEASCLSRTHDLTTNICQRSL